MADPVPTYEYYSKEFGGSLSQDDFQAVISKAVARVNARCCLFDLSDLPDKELTAYQNAMRSPIQRCRDIPHRK